jgi:hypothetical protein
MHYPFDVLPQDELTNLAVVGTIDRYRLVILPRRGGIGWTAATALDEFVARGGNLLTTGGSSFKTVDAQIASIFSKLMINSRADIITLIPSDTREKVAQAAARRPQQRRHR